MDRNSEPVKFWHVCGPLLLYWVIQFVAQLVAELAVMIPHIGQVMDYDALEKSTTTEEMTEAIMSSVQECTRSWVNILCRFLRSVRFVRCF